MRATSATYPYFFTSAAYTTAVTDWTLGTNSDALGKNNMGAAFNLNMLTREPGAYAHNRYYTKRLIFDAIDWLQNGSMTGSINVGAIPGGASDGYGGVTPVFDSNAAASYLGSVRP
ncbi:MAG TPA: hypothetical protein VJ550_11115 [Geomonas sp.]|nr:hypothetical protein [Geomonas sp.]